MNKKAVFFDIDGTLFQTGYGIPESTVRSLHKLMENGHLAFISTGRSRSNVDERLAKMDMKGMVAGAGTYIELDGEIIKNVLISKEKLEKIRKTIFEVGSEIIYEGPEYLYYDYHNEEQIKLLTERYNDVWPRHKFREFNIDEARVNKLCSDIYPETDIEYIKKELSDDFDLIFHGHAPYFELLPKGCNKAVGIEEVINRLGIDRKDTLSFGDSMNDMEMIKYTEIGVAMGNSCEELKKAADFCTKDMKEDGIEYALKHFGLI